jgi:hypothetical protein
MRASQPDEKATVFAFLSLPCMDTDSVPVYVRTDGMDPFPLDTVGPWLPSSVRGTVLTEGTFLTQMRTRIITFSERVLFLRAH